MRSDKHEMAKKQKYYVVWKGVKPGIYTSWDDCKAQVTGFEGARYKSFESAEEANQAWKTGSAPASGSKTSTLGKTSAKPRVKSRFIRESLSVDAATSGNPGPTEYQGVRVDTREQIFHKAFPKGTNNVGEFLAIVHGLALCKREGWHDLPIYSDSKTALAWVRKKKCNTDLVEDKHTAELFVLVRRAEKWLLENTWTNPLLKWETEDWGEIPADFGRK